MTDEKLYDFLKSLSLSGDEDSYDLHQILSNMGVARSEVRVHSGASKLCLDFVHEGFVIKWTHSGDVYEVDEAFAEVQIYEKAMREGLQFFFPPTELFATINNIKFVRQEKIDSAACDIPLAEEKKYVRQSRTASDHICEKIQKCFDKAADGNYTRTLNKTWAKMALVFYGKKAVKSLCSFVIENGINDLHENNIGYKNGRPIILDFSGYNR